MANTTFSNGTVVQPDWLNEVNDFVYEQNSNFISSFGGVGDGTTDNSAALTNTLISGNKRVFIPEGIYVLTSPVVATLVDDLDLFGNGRFVYTGTASTENLMSVSTNGKSLKIRGLVFDGDNKIAGGVKIENSASIVADTLPSVVVQDNTFINFKMLSASIWNNGVYIAGAFERAEIKNNNIRNITRNAGVNTPGVHGTTGIYVNRYSTTHWVKQCLHEGNSYSNITGGDLLASANNVDYDGFKYYSAFPSDSPNTDSSVYNYSVGTCVSRGNSYRNCRGRAIKIQALATVSDEKIIRDADYTINGGSTEINLQLGVGTVKDCQFFYNDYNSGGVTSPIQGPLVLVGFFQGTWYNESSGGAIVEGLQVFNGIKAGVGLPIQTIVQSTSSGTATTKDRPLVSISNVVVNRGAVDWIALTSWTTSYGLLRMENISVPELTYSAVGTNGTNDNTELMATGVINWEGVKTPANAVPWATTTGGGQVTWVGKMTGSMNNGFLQTYNQGADFNKAPMINGGALSDPMGNFGGGLSVQSVQLTDDASHTFARRFFNSGRGLVLISVNNDYTGQGVFAVGSNQVHKLAASAGDAFTVSTTGSNLDTDGKINLWFTGGALNVKNRLGGTFYVTATFLG
jgi:hypothetical protein